MKRFWDKAEVVREGGRYAIRLDGRPMRLPGGPLLTLESAALAEAIAAEWQAAGGAKGGEFQAEDVKLTRIAGTAQERVAADPMASVQALACYGESDLLCYRATAPEALVARQAKLWQPWLDWAARVHGARLSVAEGVMAVTQPVEAVEALHQALAGKPPFVLAGLGILVPATGSLVLGLAVAEGVLSPEEAHDLALLDELFQAEQWGDDDEAIARRKALRSDITDAARFIALNQ